MEEPDPQPETGAPEAEPRAAWRLLLFRGLCLLWALQVVWLAWELREEGLDLGQRLWRHAGGEAVRREDPFYRWLTRLKPVIPPEAAYLFLDNYEAGVEIEARYHLFPRRHHLLLPDSPPSLFFHTLRDEGVTFVLERQARSRPGPGLRAAMDIKAARFLEIPGPSVVYVVDPARLKGGFYD